MAKITAAKKRMASHHGIWLTSIYLDCNAFATRQDPMKPADGRPRPGPSQVAGQSSGGPVSLRLAAGGRPRGRIGPARPGSRPASARARRSRNSIWALVLRSSTLAHRARASWTAGSRRSSTLLRSVTAAPCRSSGAAPSLVEGAGVDDRLGGLLAAQHYQQVGHHGGLAFLVQLDHALLLQLLESQLDHADRALHDPLPGADHRAGLLLAQHDLGDLRGIRQPGQPRLDDVHPGRCTRVPISADSRPVISSAL